MQNKNKKKPRPRGPKSGPVQLSRFLGGLYKGKKKKPKETKPKC